MSLPSAHLTSTELKALLEESLSRPELVEGLLHLAICSRCRARFRKAYPDQVARCFRRWFGTSKLPEYFEGAESKVDVAVEWGSNRLRTAVRELEQAESHWQELKALDAGKRRLIVLNLTKFHTLGFGVVLLRASRATWLDDPEEALNLTSLAVSVIEKQLTKSPEPRIRDLYGRALAFRANCLRILNQFEGAQRNFKKAHKFLDAGTDDPLERALVLEHEGTFLRNLRRFQDALDVLGKAARLYLAAGDLDGEARCILRVALVHREDGRVDIGIAAIEALLERVEATELGMGTFVRCHHNLLLLMIDANMLDEAHARLPFVQRLVRARNNRFDMTRLEWLEALLHDKSGQDDQAEAKYLKVQRFFLDEGIGYDTAFVSLDLAAFYLDRGRYSEAQKLAAELTPVFLADDIHREAVASLLLFKEAVDRQEATGAMARATATALREMQGRPPHSRGSVH